MSPAVRFPQEDYYYFLFRPQKIQQKHVLGFHWPIQLLKRQDLFMVKNNDIRERGVYSNGSEYTNTHHFEDINIPTRSACTSRALEKLCFRYQF